MSISVGKVRDTIAELNISMKQHRLFIKYHDTFPDDYNTILSVGEFGPYTAGAIW